MTKKNTQKKLFILHNWKQCYSSEECEDKIDTEIRQSKFRSESSLIQEKFLEKKQKRYFDEVGADRETILTHFFYASEANSDEKLLKHN